MYVYPPLQSASLGQGVDGGSVRAHNTELLLRMVWEDDEGVSRAELSRQAGLSRSTVSTIIQDLLEQGLVQESHVARSGPGRPPIALRFVEDHSWIVGVEVGSSHLSAVLTDLRGTVLQALREDWSVQIDPEGTLALVERMVRQLCGTVGIAPDALLGLGLAVPCPVDQAGDGTLDSRILPSWRTVPVAQRLSDALGTPIIVDNDANCGAIAERWWGGAQDHDTFVYVKVATGVGAGVIIDGKVYGGSAGIAGEIGHTTVNPNGSDCRCGLRGCLEAEIGSEAVLTRVRKELSSGRASRLRGVSNPRLPDVVAAVHQGDPMALDVIHDVGHHLGIAVANLLNLLNPSRVILGGRVTTAGAPLLASLRETVAARAMPSSAARAEISISTLDPEPIARGAATRVLQRALREPSLFSRASARLAHSVA